VNRFSAEQQRMLEFVSIQIAKAIDQKNNISLLKRSEQRYREFVEANPVGHFIANSKGIVTDCNPAFISLFGFSTYNELIAARINIIGSSKKVRDTLLKRFHKTANVQDYKTELKGASGKAIPFVVNYTAILEGGGILQRIIGTAIRSRSKK